MAMLLKGVLMPETFKIGFSDEEFVAAVAGEVATPGVTPLAATIRFFSRRLVECLTEAMGNRLIKPASATVGTWPARYEALSRLAATGAEAWYPKLRFSTKKADAVDVALIEPVGMSLEPIVYGFGVERSHQIKVRQLKTQANHELRLNHVRLPASLFGQTLDHLKAGPALSQPYIANPEPHGSARRDDTCLQGCRPT
jgi:hypothetical protein